MAELHDALKALNAVDWADVPQDNLNTFMKHVFEEAELICNSVPSPAGGDDFESSTVTQSQVDSASSSKDITISSARPQDPPPSHVELRGSWGKPVKVGAKENPLGVSVFKMAGNDRHGAWFARRSIHEGISFSKFKQAMKWEFGESLTVEGGPGVGAVRGLAGDSRLEKQKVEGVGQLEVYQLSAQFPGPTTPREFITLLLTSDEAFNSKTADGKPAARYFVVVSKPCNHPDAPTRNGYVRGFYESVELIREIPLHHKSSADADLNPVEWIMITRSDPGGGIPRFMVERGTPGGICSDVPKFLDWATAKQISDIPDPDKEGEVTEAVEKKKQEEPAAVKKQTAGPPTQEEAARTGQAPGFMGQVTGALTAGLDAYAPASVATAAHGYLDQEQPNGSPSLDTVSSDSSSDYESADEGDRARRSTDTLPRSTMSNTESIVEPGSHRDKELQKLAAQRLKLERKLEEKSAAEESKLASQQQKDTSESDKAREKHDKEMRKVREKHDKEVAKVDAKREKELDKARKQRQKQMDRDVVNKVSRERDEFRNRLEIVQKENDLLRRQLEEAQRESAVLMQRLTKTVGSENAVVGLKDDGGAARKNRDSTG